MESIVRKPHTIHIINDLFAEIPYKKSSNIQNVDPNYKYHIRPNTKSI